MSDTIDGIRIVEMPDLGAVDDSSSVVGERLGSGRFQATALKSYILASVPAPPPPITGDIGRNLVHNPQFNVAQRGTGPFTSIGYTVDRWLVSATLDTVSITNNVAVDSDRAGIGDESVTRLLVNNFTGNAGATAVNYIAQGIESVNRLSGKTVTVSFWARCGAGALNLGVGMFQYFGTGGSPSASVGVAGQAVSLSATWAWYSKTFTLPSVAGKTLGTNNNDATWFQFFFSSGTNNAFSAGGIGVQSGAVVLWGVQIEIGSVATPLAKRDPADELALCQRFYQTGYVNTAGSGVIAVNYRVGGTFLKPMRATPTMSQGTSTDTNIVSPIITPQSAVAWVFSFQLLGSSGAYAYANTFTASADL